MSRKVGESFPQFRLGMKTLKNKKKCIHDNLHFAWLVKLMCIHVSMLQFSIEIYMVQKPRLEIKAGQPCPCQPNNKWLVTMSDNCCLLFIQNISPILTG